MNHSQLQATQTRIADIFNMVFKGHKNLLTPNVISYGAKGSRLVYELSWGTGIFNQDKIYGVTLCRKEQGEWEDWHEKSKGGFNSLEEAKEYISQVKKGES